MYDECLTLLTEAVVLYRNDFLTGFSLPDGPEFDDRQYFQAEGLQAHRLAVDIEDLLP